MAEGTHIPGTPACNEWETKLTDALDGLLSTEEEAQFDAHRLICPACAELYEEARKGRQWLEFLSPEPEAPEGLLERILATTGPGHEVNGLPVAADTGAVPAFVPPVWQQPGFMARMRAGAGPRLLMTAAMAIFSIGLTLNLVGKDVSRLRLADLRPVTLRSYMVKQLNMASVPVVRYYDHLRFVYEVKAQVRELRSGNEREENGAGQEPQQTRPATPGESRKGREPGSKGASEQESQRSIGGANEEFFETSLTFPDGSSQGSEQSRGYMVRTWERGTPWIA